MKSSCGTPTNSFRFQSAQPLWIVVLASRGRPAPRQGRHPPRPSGQFYEMEEASIPAASEDRDARMHRDAPHTCRKGDLCEPRSGSEIPDDDLAIVSARDEEPARRADTECPDWAGVTVQRGDTLPRPNIPDPDRVVDAGRDHLVPIGGEGASGDASVMTLKGNQELTILRSPQPG